MPCPMRFGPPPRMMTFFASVTLALALGLVGRVEVRRLAPRTPQRRCRRGRRPRALLDRARRARAPRLRSQPRDARSARRRSQAACSRTAASRSSSVASDEQLRSCSTIRSSWLKNQGSMAVSSYRRSAVDALAERVGDVEEPISAVGILHHALEQRLVARRVSRGRRARPWPRQRAARRTPGRARASGRRRSRGSRRGRPASQTVLAGLERTRGLLQRLAEGATDAHHLAHALHLRAEADVGAGELLEGEARPLHHHVVDGGLEGGARAGDVVLELVEREADGELGGDLRDRDSPSPWTPARSSARRADSSRSRARDPIFGSTANCTLEPPVSTPISCMTARAASRSRWYSRSVSVIAGATVIESPVCTPIGSRFSIEQMTMKLSFLSRMTSSSYSFQPSTLSSTNTCVVGDWPAPRSTLVSSSAGRVHDGAARRRPW